MQPVHLLLLFSIILILLGANLLKKNNRLRRHGKRTMATVIRNQRKFDDEGGEDYSPVVEFHTEKQELITFVLSSATTSEPTPIGKKIEVTYNPNDPHEVETNSFLRLTMVPWIFILLGIAALILSGLEILGITNIVMTQWESAD